ncbi:hypothetical protein [Rickettsia endosymbiont of Cantharis rufa]|uniref:hypothetical protein n=1 Tax=Rickettsia endosymbiont of Cantharis rufa TaxID=3066248 RepID=UPI00313348B3
MEEQNKGILTLFESVNSIFFTKQDDSNHRKAVMDAKKIGKPISKGCIQHSNSEERSHLHFTDVDIKRLYVQ